MALKNKKNLREHLPKVLILFGVILAAIVIILLKQQQDSAMIATLINESAEEQLDRYMEEEIPVFAFFHSNNCNSCLIMIDTVNQVYPSYQDKIAFVDVDVYDAKNQNLLQRAGIYSIPTQIFIDSTGQGMVTIGAMTNEELTQQFQKLLGE